MQAALYFVHSFAALADSRDRIDVDAVIPT